MRTITIILGTKENTYTGPSTWSEVDPQMALKLFNLVKVALTKKHLLYAVPMLLYKIPYKTMGIFFDARIAARRYKAVDNDENPDSLVLLGEQILDSCKWVYSEEPPVTFVLKHINVKGKTLEAVADRLHSLTFEDFILAESYVESDLAKLCAILYRETNTSEKQSPPDGSHKNEIANLLRGEGLNTVRNLVAWNYAGMVKNLHRVFTHVFEKPRIDPELQIVLPPPPKTSWLDAALDFADNDPIKFHALEKENLYMALKMIDNRIKQNKEIKAQADKLNKK